MLTIIDLSSTPPGKIVGTADIGHESLEGMMMSVTARDRGRGPNAPQLVVLSLDGGSCTSRVKPPVLFGALGRTATPIHLPSADIIMPSSDSWPMSAVPTILPGGRAGKDR